MTAFDWDHIRAFVVTARCGKLTEAAARLQTDHTTVSRRITALEKSMQAKLFDRSPAGYAITEQGQRLLPIAEQMETLAGLASQAVGGAAKAIQGSVRVAGPEGFCSYFLAPRLSQLTREYNGLNVQLVAGTRVFSLSKREADIAITLSRPTEGRLIARKLTDFDLGLYAARDYLAEHGPIRSRADLSRHDFVGYIGDLLQIPELDYLDQVNAGSPPRLESSNLLVQVMATKSGAGLCVLPHFIAMNEPELAPILPGEIGFSRSFWLVVHADYKDQARVRLTAKFILDEVRKTSGMFSPFPVQAVHPPISPLVARIANGHGEHVAAK